MDFNVNLTSKEPYVKLIVSNSDGDHVFEKEHPDEVRFMGIGDNGEYLPDGMYIWHSFMKPGGRWNYDDKIDAWIWHTACDVEVIMKMGCFDISRIKDRIFLDGVGWKHKYELTSEMAIVACSLYVSPIPNDMNGGLNDDGRKISRNEAESSRRA